jgi:S-DNA-T family DNA segregation ATPase FtsK/SpoIIIE
MKDFIESEIRIINDIFRHNNIMAKVFKAENVLNSFIRYHLSLHASQKFSDIEKLNRELSAALNKNRQKIKFVTTDILLTAKPNFGLEVTLPNSKPLLWSIHKTTNLESHTMLAGLSTIDSKPELITFGKTPHTLIAGMTNAGKSVLLQMMLLSLTANTSPEELGLVLVDLKNEDLAPFKNLPHVLRFCCDQQSAMAAIDWMLEEKNKRVESNEGKRIVLVIDELAQLASLKGVANKLGDLASIGRSKRLNLIAATQAVTKDGGLGSMMKSNFNCRLIGKVVPGLSAIATGLAGMQAHLLPGSGSFLRIEGTNNHRIQSYFIEQNDVVIMIKWICDKWLSSGYVSGYNQHNQQLYTSEVETRPITSYPITSLRNLTEEEKQDVLEFATQSIYHYQGKISLNKLTYKVFGSKSPDRLKIIKEILV